MVGPGLARASHSRYDTTHAFHRDYHLRYGVSQLAAKMHVKCSQEGLGCHWGILNRILCLEKFGAIQPSRKTSNTCEDFHSCDRTAFFDVCFCRVADLIPSSKAGEALIYLGMNIKSMWESLIRAEVGNLVPAPNVTFTSDICDWDCLGEVGWVQLCLQDR